MPRITRFALVPYSAEKMFELVNDVESYPSFLPGCASSQVLESSLNAMTASVELAKAGIRKRFTTRNELVTGEAINMELVNGPFQRLVGGWSFRSLDVNACKIELNLDFEFTNCLIGMAFGQMFNELVINMMKAFPQRARIIYE
ncbi:SRPBCC family protein [Candidatus Enterovibrio escicola]|uniref:Putative oligoketide cyclase n=1 Tax=Candidatus Enterovibrio escicola TaxID=1927127 RepID=A0A2A5T5P5_9GAMM|nr:SRPBCC family protein [Candidatus Enterovibrio escacola]PCS23430.1 putative oligoketide cyclase [Candidatus Enterovibrio escacola]